MDFVPWRIDLMFLVAVVSASDSGLGFVLDGREDVWPLVLSWSSVSSWSDSSAFSFSLAWGVAGRHGVAVHGWKIALLRLFCLGQLFHDLLQKLLRAILVEIEG